LIFAAALRHEPRSIRHDWLAARSIGNCHRIVERARRLQRFLTQPFTVTESFTGVPGCTVALADTIAGCLAILDGDCDDWQESSLFMIGTLADARAKEAAANSAAAP